MLDAVAPAVAALVESADHRAPLLDALKRAEAEANRGMEQTSGLRSRLGRAAALGDRSVGHPDAGAACVCFILHSVVEYASGVRG